MKPLVGEEAKAVYGDLKTEARLNTARIVPAAVALNLQVMRLFVQPGLAALAQVGEPDTRCGTCAYRPGTVGAAFASMGVLGNHHGETNQNDA